MTQLKDDMVMREGVCITFRYCRSRRKTLGMIVRPDKSVTVRAPLRASLGEIRDFVSRKSAWIARVWQRFDTSPPPKREDTTTVRFLGREYPIRMERGAEEAITLRHEALVVRIPPETDAASLPLRIEAWYRAQARELFGARLRACHAMLADENLPLPPVVIRTMKSRWGSYSRRTGRICLNLALVKVPLPCLDYVIIHELCHMRELNHGPRFWKLVARYVPDHAARRRQLRMAAPV